MDPQRHQRITEIFLEACELPEEERSRFLDEACAGDKALREAVEALLEHDRAVHTSMEQAEASSGATSPFDPAALLREPPDPERIGPYRILQKLGSGGMGVVYLAEQREPVRRRVALKVIRAGLGSREVVVRFEAERQALALMDHPNIAKVFDAGAAEDGRPYFVMEHIPGEPITRYCQRLALPLNERLDLFLQVCDAVQHAHQKGVIHRDIKPSNVLVVEREEGPLVKVIDFGVAKAVQQPLATRTLFTRAGQLVGTPEYMSPEQADAADVDTRSDVYSLGVLLYELVTGELPFDAQTLRKAGYAEIQRIIREVEPPKPSTKLSLASRAGAGRPSTLTPTTALLRQVRGELDWIVMKALEKDRERRYGAVSALAEDLRRRLRNEPVEAGPPSALYRARKFVRRHRAGVAATTLAAASLLVATVVSTLFAVDAQRARDFAQKRDEAGRRLAAALLGPIHDAVNNLAGATEARLQLLDASSEYLESMEAQAQGDPQLLGEIASSYERLAMAQGADLAGSAGESAQALDAARKAVALRRQLAGAAEGDSAKAARTAQLALASALELRGQLEQRLLDAQTALATYEEALAARRAALRHAPHDPQALASTAASLMRLGDIAKRQGRYDRAQALYEEALALREQAAALGESQAPVAALLIRLANLAMDRGRPDEARRRSALALAIREQAANADPTDTRAQRSLLWALYFAADPALAAGEVDDATAMLQRARRIAQARFDADPANARAASDLLLVEERLGDVLLHDREDPAAAVEVYQRVAERMTRAVAQDPDDAQTVEHLADALARLARALREAGNASDAVVQARRGLGALAPLVAKDPSNHNRLFVQATLLTELGQALQRTDRPAEAREALEQAAQTYQRMEAATSADLAWRLGYADALRALSQTLLSLGDGAGARAAARRAVKLLPAQGQDPDADAIRLAVEPLLAGGAG